METQNQLENQNNSNISQNSNYTEQNLENSLLKTTSEPYEFHRVCRRYTFSYFVLICLGLLNFCIFLISKKL